MDAMIYVLVNRGAFMMFDINAKSQEKDWVLPEKMTYADARLTHEDWTVVKQSVGSLHFPTTLWLHGVEASSFFITRRRPRERAA